MRPARANTGRITARPGGPDRGEHGAGADDPLTTTDALANGTGPAHTERVPEKRVRNMRKESSL